ncbi:glutaminase [Crocosphaera subtropica ATCC 51142]|uniref:Glutaminase n=1 Tax=Crocosphaera subtropica (strain ATCC 51142 / BH68) TaxID=43989 RepID=B1WV28_CROS5|nr:glutaminase A [Crocosphaera subtropica]ACB52225.1 glutaminase [Crocosphaera subtropica ATCC 51142]
MTSPSNSKTWSHLSPDDPFFSESCSAFLEDLYQRYFLLKEGQNADYIPELAKVNPDLLAITIVTTQGKIYSIGDTSDLFTIQSIAKPLVYGMVLEDWGWEYVLNKIGVEPTGEPFNDIIDPDEIQERKYNPMVNAGAITTTSLVKGKTLEDRQQRLLAMFRGYFGRDVQVDQSIFWSRKTRDNWNRAIAYMMLSFGVIEEKIEEVLDLYFQQCSVLVNCQDLALMAATLANAGLNPITGERALNLNYAKSLMSVMYSSGLYQISGQWAYQVGLPAKSGLSGAIVGIVPHQMGIAVFSPPLGEHKKSVRGVKIFQELSQQFQLHIFDQIHIIDPQQKEKDKPFLFSSQSPSITNFLDYLYEKYLPLDEGNIYVSEPDIVEIDPNWFSICIVTTDGQFYGVGDVEQSFLIQSISKVFAYGLALEDHGRDYVLKTVDVEPTGDAYNSIIKVEENSKRPYNAMVNTGAIAITNLIKGKSPAHKLNRILKMYQQYIGHPVYVDTGAVVSEQTKGDRNWAISYLLRNFGMISGDIKETLQLYLQQCSVIIDCRDLAIMAATLANNGRNPMTGKQAIDPDYIKDLLSVMFTCGMYDFAGEWAYKVGFPAKSGVGGGILAVVPGVMGIGVFSPPLDKRGNSIRGIKVCEELSHHFRLHIFEPMSSPI